METIDKLRLSDELKNEHCVLNHGPGTKGEDYPAVDYLVVRIGETENIAKEASLHELVIPVCYECAQALLGNEWTLLYCIDCNSNQWVYRKLARLRYRHNVLWLRGCPKCTGKLRGLYFADSPGTKAQATLLVEEKIVETVD